MDKYCKIFKVLSEEKRLKLLTLLLKKREGYYVCEIADALKETHYNVSKYLQELKVVGLVKEKREGRLVMYSVNENIDSFVKKLFKIISQISDEYIEKNVNLLKIRESLRENNKCVVGVNDPKWKRIVSKIEKEERLKITAKGG
ncbi:MAG: ArsR/SmtB family transcription factor [Caldisericia bacterium]